MGGEVWVSAGVIGTAVLRLVRCLRRVSAAVLLFFGNVRDRLFSCFVILIDGQFA